MPANYPIESVYLQTGLAQTENNTSLFKLGELGARFIDSASREWQRVQLDSGATSGTGVGAVAAGQLAYWRPSSVAPFLVTNDFRMASGGGTANSGFRNFVAGVFENVKSDNATALTLTPGNYICIQTRGASLKNVVVTGSPAVGDLLVSDTTASTAQVAGVAAGTAPTCLVVGVATGAVASGAIPATLTVGSQQV